MNFSQLRVLSGMTQDKAAQYLYCSPRTYKRIEASNNDPARLELFALKLQRDGYDLTEVK